MFDELDSFTWCFNGERIEKDETEIRYKSVTHLMCDVRWVMCNVLCVMWDVNEITFYHQ